MSTCSSGCYAVEVGPGERHEDQEGPEPGAGGEGRVGERRDRPGVAGAAQPPAGPGAHHALAGSGAKRVGVGRAEGAHAPDVPRGVPVEEALAAGEPVVLYPEGSRQSGPVVQPLFEGAVFVAARVGVPIVPVGIGGSEWAMPKGSRGIRPVRIAAVVGEPIAGRA